MRAKIQQLTIDRAMFAPVMDLRTLNGIGPRVTRHTIIDLWTRPFQTYDDLELHHGPIDEPIPVVRGYGDQGLGRRFPYWTGAGAARGGVGAGHQGKCG